MKKLLGIFNRLVRLLFLWFSASAFGAGQNHLLMVADFDHGVQNRLGGYYNKYESAPSHASTSLSTTVFRGGSGRSLRIDAHCGSGGFCGAWIHLFDFHASVPQYLDTQSHAFLSFWVKGAKGGEVFAVKLADESWIKKEDSQWAGRIERFLPEGVTTNWQEVLVPLDKVPRLDRSRMGGVTFDFQASGDFTVYIDDVCFKSSENVRTPVSAKGLTSIVSNKSSFPRAMWVWKTEPLLLNRAKRKEFFAFCAKERIGTVWLQVLTHFEPAYDVFGAPSGPPPENFRAVLEHPAELRSFLKEAHAVGLKIHALDGYPEYAQKEYHYAPLAIVDSVIAFNQSVPPLEGYDGIHFDNEPYLIVGWEDLDQRKQILQEFLALNGEIQRRVDQVPNLEFGIDIPFWFQDLDRNTGKPIGLVRYNGVEKAASYHCIDMLDNVGIMNYRDSANGADGIIAHGQDLIRYGEKTKHAKIFMGTETFSYEKTQVWFVLGLPHERFKAVLRSEGIELSGLSRIRGFRIQVLDDGSNFHVGIELPPQINDQSEKIQKTLLDISRRLSVASFPELEDQAEEIRAVAMQSLKKNPKWSEEKLRNIPDPSGGDIPGFLAVGSMLGKVSFSAESCDYIHRQLDLSEAFFRTYGCFAGMAIHYYETFRKKCGEDVNL
jgi:hypothetical protein